MCPALTMLVYLSAFPPFVAYHRAWDGRANGVYWKEDVFAAINSRQLPNSGEPKRFGGARGDRIATVYRTGAQGFDGSAPAPVVCATPSSFGRSFRFAISGEFGQFGHDWAMTTFPIADLPVLENTGFGRELYNAKFNPKRDAVPAQYIPFDGDCARMLFPKHRAWDITEEALLTRLVDQSRVFPDVDRIELPLLIAAFVTNATFDTLPIDAASLRLFHALDGRLAITTEPVPYAHPHRSLALGKKPAPIPERDLRAGRLPASFRGRFHAYAVGDLHYLLTAGGRLYRCAAKGEADLAITEVWSDPARPLVGGVDCPDTKQAFAFGWGSKPGNTDRYWVEFGDKPAPTAYTLKAKLKNNREDAFREVNDCVRALAAAKAFKPAPKPEPKK